MKIAKGMSLLLLAIAPPALAAPPEGFDKRVEELRKTAELPGLAIAIVENG